MAIRKSQVEKLVTATEQYIATANSKGQTAPESARARSVRDAAARNCTADELAEYNRLRSARPAGD